MDLRKLIQDYLQEAKVMQIATVKNSKPWIATVNFAFDSEWNLYWVSLRSTKHSKDLDVFPHVAGAIVKDPHIVQGIQFEGSAKEVTGEELEKANEVYEARYGAKPERLEEAMSQNPTVRGYYKVTLTKVVLYDPRNFPDNPRQELVLS